MRRICGITLLMSVVLDMPAVLGAQYNQLTSLRIAVVVCDKVGLDPNTVHTARNRLQRIFQNAGVDLTWIDSEGSRTPAKFLMMSLEGCELPSVDSDFFAIVASGSPAGWPRETLGLSAPGALPPHRVYVVYDRVNEIVSRVTGSDAGTFLAHVIAHELGHLLLGDSQHSPSGVMSTRWHYRQIVETAQGLLQFHPTEVRRIRTVLRSRSSVHSSRQ